MKFPLSLHGRIALAAFLMSGAILLLNYRGLVDIVTLVVSDNVDLGLDSQVKVLENAVASDGHLRVADLESWPELRNPPRGWGWRVDTPAGYWSRGDQSYKVEYPLPWVHVRNMIYSGRGQARGGNLIHLRRRDNVIHGMPVTVVVISPSSIIDDEVARVQDTEQRYMVILLLVLLVSGALQLHFGLRPLRRLRSEITQLGNGALGRLPMAQPVELRGVAGQINALIERNDAALETARINAANLAHALKTPLAALMLELQQTNASHSARALVQDISDKLTYHLNRARSGAVGLGGRARCDAAQVVGEVFDVIAMLDPGRAVRLDNRIAAGCWVAVDHHDMTEMLGNLIENAARFAHSLVWVEAHEEAAGIIIKVADDGDGISPDQIDKVLQPGVRLDSVNEGYGFGLAIVREFAEMYGGTFRMALGAEGRGLVAILSLPS